MSPIKHGSVPQQYPFLAPFLTPNSVASGRAIDEHFLIGSKETCRILRTNQRAEASTLLLLYVLALLAVLVD
eukprot:34972-Eustigmatos_ZCMA.PRE.1